MFRFVRCCWSRIFRGEEAGLGSVSVQGRGLLNLVNAWASIDIKRNGVQSWRVHCSACLACFIAKDAEVARFRECTDVNLVEEQSDTQLFGSREGLGTIDS